MTVRPFLPGPLNPRWNGGRTRTPKGYIRLKSGPYAGWYEHRAVAHRLLGENVISREVVGGPEVLADLVVHHMDFRRDHNCPHNLLICHPAFHPHACFPDEDGRRWADLPEEMLTGAPACP